jgi:hypothetical protein
VIKNERQNLFFVFLIYFGDHFVRPCVFFLRTPNSVVISVTKKRTIHISPERATINRSMSEFSSASHIARELQIAMRRTLGNNQHIQRANLWRQKKKEIPLFIVLYQTLRNNLFQDTSFNKISLIWDFHDILGSKFSIFIPMYLVIFSNVLL